MRSVSVATPINSLSFSTLQCGSWIDAHVQSFCARPKLHVSVPFNAGRGLMHDEILRNENYTAGFSTLQCGSWIDALIFTSLNYDLAKCFSTLQCGSWIDASACMSIAVWRASFSTLQCGSWIDAPVHPRPCQSVPVRFSTLQCGSWIDAPHTSQVNC